MLNLDPLFKALAPYPFIEISVSLLILLAGWRIIMVGKKDGPAPPAPSAYSHEYPAWLLSGPVHDAMVHVASIKHEMVRCRELLDKIEGHTEVVAKNSVRQTQILEMVQNENVINPRRLRE